MGTQSSLAGSAVEGAERGPAPPRRWPRATPHVLVLGLFLGAATGFLLSLAHARGYAVRWERLGAPPGEVVALSDEANGIVAVLDDGRAYHCEPEGCEQVDFDGTPRRSWPDEGCGEGPAFAWLNNAPRRPLDCVQYMMAGTGFIWEIVAIDQDGGLWRWRHIQDCDITEELLLMQILMLAGAIGGLLVGALGVSRLPRAA